MSTLALHERPARPELTHQALIYGSDEAFLAATTAFCLDGLAAGDKVLAVTTTANVGLLRAHLGGAAGEVEFVDADDWYHAPGRTLGAYSRYVEEHKGAHERVRIIGEPVWHGRDLLEEAEWTRYESVINAAFADSPAWIVCPYDERVLPEHIVAHARRTHPQVLTGDEVQASGVYTDPAAFTYDGDRLPLPHPPASASRTVMDIAFGSDLGPMRQQVASHARRLGLSGERMGVLVMAVSELATNAVRHGAGHGRVRLWHEGARVVCDVTDPGRLEVAFPGYLPPDPAAPHGHGLWVVRHQCDLLQVRSGPEGTQIRLHLKRL